MGEVYRAKDLRLREVPNIVTLFSVEDAETDSMDGAHVREVLLERVDAGSKTP